MKLRRTALSLMCLSFVAGATQCSAPSMLGGDTESGVDGGSEGSTDVDSEPFDDGATDASDASVDVLDAADSNDAAEDAPADATPDASNPLCEVAANLFEPGARCGVEIAAQLACTHSITQKAMSAGCCVPKDPGVACVPAATVDSKCCVSPGIYCGLVEETTHSVPVTLTLTRGARKGLQICQFGATTLGTTKVTVKGTGPKAGISLALAIFEKPRCSGGTYNASFTRTDAVDTYGGTWIDHPSVSQNRDSSGEAVVTVAADGVIAFDASGTVPMDTGAGTPTRIRRTNVGTCSVVIPAPEATALSR